MDTQKAILKNQVYGYHGLNMVSSSDLNDKYFNPNSDELKKKLHLPPIFQYAEQVVDNMESSLNNNFAKMLKTRDKFIGSFMTIKEKRKINEWILSVIELAYRKGKKRVSTDGSSELPLTFHNKNKVDQFIKTSIIFPTELSLNTWNMLNNGPYIYSDYTDRDPNHPDISWSGFNLEYGIEKRQSPIERAILIFAIIEAISTSSLDVYTSINSLVSDRVVQDISLLDNHNVVDTLFDIYAESLHNKIVSGIDIVYLSKMINLYIDYANTLNVVPWIENKDNNGFIENYHNTVSVLTTKPINVIVEVDSVVIIQTEGYKLWGFDFKRDLEVMLYKTNYSPSSMDQLLKDELRYSELMGQFVKCIPPKKYIISERRPEGDYAFDGRHNKKFKYDTSLNGCSRLDVDNDSSEKELNRVANREKEHEIRMATLAEKRQMRSEIGERSRQLAELRRKHYIAEFERKQTDRNYRDQLRSVEQQEKIRNKILQSKYKREELESRLLGDFNKELRHLIDKKYASEALDEKQRRELIAMTAKGMDKSNETIRKLMQKLILATDRIAGKDTMKELSERESGFLSSDSLEILSSHMNNVDSLMKTINDVVNNLCLDQIHETDSGEAVKIKQIVSAMESKVESIMLDNLKNLDKEMRNAQDNVEEIYKRIDSVLRDEEQSSVSGEAMLTVNYPYELGDYCLDVNDSVYGMEIDGATAKVDNSNSMLHEIREVIGEGKEDSFREINRSSTVKIIDKKVAKLVETLRKRFKKNVTVLRAVNEDSKKISALYSDACRDKNVYKMKLEAAYALINDAKIINSLISKTLNSAARVSKQEMGAIKKKLNELIERVKKKELKDLERTEALKRNVDRVISEIVEISSSTDKEIKKIRGLWSTIDLDEFDRNVTSKGLSDRIIEKKNMYDDLINQFNERERMVRARFDQSMADFESGLETRNNLSDNLFQQQNVSDVNRPNSEHTENNNNKNNNTENNSAVENDKLAAINRLQKEYLEERKKRKRYAVEAINKGNSIYEKFIKLQRSSWTNLNGVKCGQLDDEPNRYVIDGIFRKAHIENNLNKESVNYVKEELKDKWHLIANEKFISTKYVTPTGVTTTIKSIKHTFFEFVFPCLRILYRKDLLLDYNIHTILRSETQTSLDVLKAILMSKRLREYIQKRVDYEREKRNNQDKIG